jgi:hypothetical protein
VGKIRSTDFRPLWLKMTVLVCNKRGWLELVRKTL